MNVPITNGQDHIRESQSLEMDGYVHLLHIRAFPPNAAEVNLYLSTDIERTWQGITFENIPWHISDTSQSSDGELSRPILTIFNSEGLFTRYALAKYLDNAEITRYSILSEHYAANINSYIRGIWRVSNIMSATKQMLAAQLRGALDGPAIRIPARRFVSPEFTQVSL